jgi:hypothetical protein
MNEKIEYHSYGIVFTEEAFSYLRDRCEDMEVTLMCEGTLTTGYELFSDAKYSRGIVNLISQSKEKLGGALYAYSEPREWPS